MKKNLFNILSSGLQAISVQIIGILFFYVLSLYVSKADFGIIGWANAVSMLLVTILSFGMEQVVVRRVASSGKSDWAATAFLLHAFISSIFALLILYIVRLIPGISQLYYYLPLFFAVQSLTFIATPLRQYLNAKERFGPYGIIAFLSNLGKLIAVYYFAKKATLAVTQVGYILAFFALVELLSLAFLFFIKKDLALPMKFRFGAYKKLIRESMPQYVSSIFDSSLSRIDWILLGVLSSAANIADYSFAYRAYEICKLPLVILGPILLAKYSKMLVNKLMDETKVQETKKLIFFLVFIAVVIIMCCNVLWAPVMDQLTRQKYGSSNALIFLILSACLPLHFLINIFWTISFAGRKYRPITKITIATATTNLIANLVFIPLWGAIGAAVAYLLSTILQVIIYYIVVSNNFFTLPYWRILLIPVLGIACLLSSVALTHSIVGQLLIGVGAFASLSFASRLIRPKDVLIIKAYLKR